MVLANVAPAENETAFVPPVKVLELGRVKVLTRATFPPDGVMVKLPLELTVKEV